MIGVLVSGGKDSTATLLLAVERYGNENVIGIFTDTGWEHSLTYEYLDYLERVLGVHIIRLSPSCTLVDLIRRWKRFPNSKIRFCTGYLKTRPVAEFLAFSSYDITELWIGIRKSESRSRRIKYTSAYMNCRDWLKWASLRKDIRNKLSQITCHFPLLCYSVPQVFQLLRSQDIQPNPLYSRGFTRVGCFPCILGRLREFEHCWKDEEGKRNILTLARVEKELNSQGYPARLKDWITAQQLVEYLKMREKQTLF